MLNTSQSSKKNLWKYSLVLPLVAAFILCFQVRVIAKEAAGTAVAADLGRPVTLIIDKNTSDDEIKQQCTKLKKEHGITLKVSKVKRNSDGEITSIKVEFKDKDGNKGVSHVEGDEPIAPIRFYKEGGRIGFGGRGPAGPRMFVKKFNDSIRTEDFDFAFEMPELPEMPELAEMPEMPEFEFGDDMATSFVYSKSGDGEPLIIINGKKVDAKDLKDVDPNLINSIDVLKDEGAMKLYGKDAKGGVIVVKTKDLEIISDQDQKKAREQARIEIEKARPEMERAKREMERVRIEMSADRKAEVDKARDEMQKAKEEMLKAKAEMEKAKAELEKARADLKKKV